MALEIIDEQAVLENKEEMVILMNKAVEKILTHHGLTAELEITLVLTDDKEIQQLNSEFRQINKATDVLSFPQFESISEIKKDVADGTQLLLGDIVISMETTIRQAEEYGHKLSRELLFLFVHGCLHLLGYDHIHQHEQSIMRNMEEKFMAELDLPR